MTAAPASLRPALDPALAEQCVATLRGLAIDAIQRANSGHPGMPMGMADAAFVLWSRALTVDPGAPEWADRDRFVLSAGHGSMLLYGLLHLSGFDVSLQDLQAFRQWGSRTPGHPEVGHTPGVEATTGPLGQGISMAVGMALAEARLRADFGADLCDHRTFVIAGDGCLMEGISSEAASLAGHLGLGRLIVLYDDNGITIDGSTAIAFSEDVGARFSAFGWQVLSCDGHDRDAVAGALEQAIADGERPSLIRCRTRIGRMSPSFEGQARTHGAPLGAAEVAATKKAMGMDPAQDFAVPAAVATAMAQACGDAGRRAHAAWRQRHLAHPRAAAWDARMADDLGAVTAAIAWPSQAAGKGLATRKASQQVIQAVAAALPGLVGGSADLEESNGTHIGGEGHLGRGAWAPRNIHFGVREHAMGAVANGLALHGGHVPFVATFLVFHDYMRPAVRLSALMGQRVLYIYTHDSIFLGEDGPTHQPVETLLALRSIPGLDTYRPADLAETAACWRLALERRDGPSALCLTRQNLPELDHSDHDVVAGCARGAYVVRSWGDAAAPAVVMIGTGSEVALAMEAAALVAAEGVAVRVVSMPCCERFDGLTRGERDAIVPPTALRVSVEAGTSRGWERYIGSDGLAIALDRFGASAPASVLAEQFGFVSDQVAARVRAALASRRG